MYLRTTLLSLLSLLILANDGIAQASANGVELTTVKAPWSLRILDQGLDISGEVQARPDQASAYFMMSNEKLNVSVFIERVDKCKSAEACRDYVLGLGNPAWGSYQDLAKGKIGDASYFEFYRPEVQGQPVKMLDMYAEFVQDGYWVDMHISKVLYEKKDHALFEAVVNSAKFLPKTDKRNSIFDNQLSQVQAATRSWLSLWDSLRCKESYAALSTIGRGVTEQEWVDYCKTYAGGLGKNSSRNIIAVAFKSSLPTKTERPLAILAYQSDFTNKPDAVELVALILETDGKWLVTNHVFN